MFTSSRMMAERMFETEQENECFKQRAEQEKGTDLVLCIPAKNRLSEKTFRKIESSFKADVLSKVRQRVFEATGRTAKDKQLVLWLCTPVYSVEKPHIIRKELVTS